MSDATLESAPAHDTLQDLSVKLFAGTTSVPDWRRGRPRSSWLRGVLKDVGLHLPAQEAWTVDDDREEWRAAANGPLSTTRSDDDDDDDDEDSTCDPNRYTAKKDLLVLEPYGDALLSYV